MKFRAPYAACEGALARRRCRPRSPSAKLSQRPSCLRPQPRNRPCHQQNRPPTADIEGVRRQIEDVIGLDASNAICCSAKSGIGIEEILERILSEVPQPKEPEDDILRALVFDSHYDTYRGVMVYIRVISGEIQKGSHIKMMATNKKI